MAARRVSSRSENSAGEHQADLAEASSGSAARDRDAHPRPRVATAIADMYSSDLGREEVLGEAQIRHAGLDRQAARQQEGQRPQPHADAVYRGTVHRRGRVDQA